VSRWIPPLVLGTVALAIGIGAGLQQQKSPARLSLEAIAAHDPRIEFVARAICRARGIYPDYQGFPYPPGPVWETFILQARDFLAADDAADQWAHRKPKTNGPPY